MTKVKRILLCLIGGMVLVNNVWADGAKIRLGSVAMDSPQVMHKRLAPLVNYLEKELGQPITLSLSPNMKHAINAVASNKVDIAYLTPVAYLRAHKKGNAQVIVKTVTSGKSHFNLMIAVHQNSDIQSVRDLVGTRFAFGDKAALLQRAAVVGSGIELKEFKKYDFLGHYDSIVRGILHGDYEAGILKDTMALKWHGRGLRILYTSPDLPPYNISVGSDVSAEMKEKIKKAFLSLNIHTPGHLEVIKSLDPRYDGFVAGSDADYDVIRKMIKPFVK